MAINDELFKLDVDLAKYPGNTADDAMNRRLILRKALKRIEDTAYQLGYGDAIRDSADARILAQRAQDEAGKRAALLGEDGSGDE